jgi:hypothetical protein
MYAPVVYPAPLPQPKRQVIVRKKLDGAIRILWEGKPLKIKEVLPKKEADQSAPNVAPDVTFL